MLKVYISPLGIGLGHASRCVSLGRRLKESGFEVYFSTYGEAINYVKKHMNGAEIIEGGEEMMWRQGPDGQPDIRGTLTSISQLKKFINHINREKDNIERISPDVVISDSRISTLMASYYLDFPTVVVLNQPKLLLAPLIDGSLNIFSKSHGLLEEDYGLLSKLIEKIVNSAITRLWALSHASLIADFPPPDTISRFHTNGLPQSLALRTVFTGPLIEPKCKDDQLEDLVLILISGPGAERRSLWNKLSKVLEKIPEDLKKFHFIISLGEVGEARSYQINENVTVYSWLPNKWDLLSKAKLVVSRAGHTTISEALVCGKPLLMIPVPGQTEKYENARNIHRMGLGVMLEQAYVEEKFFPTLRYLLNNETICRRVSEFRNRYRDWDFLDRALGVIMSVIY